MIDKKTCLSNIEEYLKIMRLLTIKSGIKEERYDSIIGKAKELDIGEIEKLQDALLDIMGLQWKMAYDVWILPSMLNPEKAEEVWNNYEMMGLEDHLEQKMLKKVLRELGIEFRRIINTCLPRKRKSVSSTEQQEKQLMH
jgi:hypothetical protein